MEITRENIGKYHHDSGGFITDIYSLPHDTEFIIRDLCWFCTVIEEVDEKVLQYHYHDGDEQKVEDMMTLLPDDESNIRSIEIIRTGKTVHKVIRVMVQAENGMQYFVSISTAIDCTLGEEEQIEERRQQIINFINENLYDIVWWEVGSGCHQ